MEFKLMKQVDGDWYKYGTYTEKNITTLCQAYVTCAKSADDVKIEVDQLTCADCKYLEVKEMAGMCKYMVGIRNPNDYCCRGERR